MSMRRWWISDKEALPVAKQCTLASVNRSTVYLPSIVLFPDVEELHLLELISFFQTGSQPFIPKWLVCCIPASWFAL